MWSDVPDSYHPDACAHLLHRHLMPGSPRCVLACHSFWHKSPYGGHHVTRSPTGTFSSTPRRTSSSKPALTSSCQCTATGIGLYRATGVASLSIISRKGGPDIMGSVWWVHVLNVLAAYRLFSHNSIAARFSSVAGIGRPSGSGGGPVRGVHGHGSERLHHLMQ